MVDVAARVSLSVVASSGQSVQQGALCGVVSAGDVDEQRLFALLSRFAQRCPAMDLTTQGAGSLPATDVDAALTAVQEIRAEGLADLAESSDGVAWVERWADVVHGTLAAAAAAARGLTWATTYDVGGSTDDGASEYHNGAQLIS